MPPPTVAGGARPAAPESDESSAAAPDAAAALLEDFEDPDVAVFTDDIPAANTAKKPSTLTLEEASARIGSKVLQVLEEKFNGSLAEVRAADGKDQFFQ